MDQHAQAQTQFAFEKLRALGALVYRDPAEDGFEFLLGAQTQSGKQFANYEVSHKCDNEGLYPHVVEILEQHSMLWAWVNPEVIGVWYEADY